MAKPPRDLTPYGSNTYFITTSSWGHSSLFQSDRLAQLFLKTLFDYRDQGKFFVHEFVVMPDHIHLLITPIGISLERAMQFIKGGFSYRARKERGLTTELWSRGYVDHRIRDLTDYQKHTIYIRQNPVRARLANHAEEYPYNSALRI